MQSLLTLGLMEAVMERPVPENVMIMQGQSGELLMTNDGLDETIQDWINAMQHRGQDELQTLRERIDLNLTRAQALLLAHFKAGFRVFDPLGDDVPSLVCFIGIVCESLTQARMAFPSNQPHLGLSWWMVLPKSYQELIRREMTEDGWCPSMVEYLINLGSTSVLEYACKAGPVEGGYSHEACSPVSCAAYNVDPENYIPKHTHSCMQKNIFSSGDENDCGYCAAPLDQVKSLILSGEKPVLTLCEVTGHRLPVLELHKASDFPYVAISHVWADGLGSTTEKGLPACQLRRLASLVSEESQAREQAIAMMARIYQDAAAVLVLDSGLQICRSDQHLGTKLLRTLTCGWMRRLWTLQEAALSKELHLVLADGQCPLKALIPHGSLYFQRPLLDLAAELFRLTKWSTYGSYSLGDVARALTWRNTSKRSDETLAVAGLLDVKPSILTAMRPEERIMRLMQVMGRVPRNVLFLHGKKLQLHGFSWAPTSFMAAHGGAAQGPLLSTSDTDAVVTPRGLAATYFALVLPRKMPKKGLNAWRLRDTKTGKLYLVAETESDKTEPNACDLLLTPNDASLGSVVSCVGALITGHVAEPACEESNSPYTVFCRFRRRLLLHCVTAFTNDSEVDEVETPVSGKLSVCVG
ncbi:hypothetical protein CP533_1243 [Ophiocordyceps camponoti-saundersi (nom. inval.)]|nr:hypothetical protein CP533_1243 [Ophiocordyceps camponoti-saundersi (nom. inval.)]